MANISLQEAYDQARRWIESDDPERAIGLAQHILTQYPDNLEAFRILGEAYIADRQLEQAQKAFERVLRSDPENVPAHVGLGITHERQGRLDRAIPQFEQAWEIKPEMTELRSQLLRLYADAWGSEHAQLRLRGGGLARLYAKGHMLPQAIAEFRKVIDDQPERYDAKVALAEALWRNGEEDESRDLSRQLIGERSALLKPNLLLGYIELASGSASGQPYWDAAYAMDPYEAVAQAMFQTLPHEGGDTPMIEEWDEDAWRQQRQQDQQELDATRPIPVPLAQQADEESSSWLDQMPATLPPPPPLAALTNPAANDDFLAGLLGMPEPASPSTAAAQNDSTTVQAFDDADVLSPFSLSELGLSDEEFASLDTLSPPTSDVDTPASEARDQTDATVPFSASDLGLDDETAFPNTSYQDTTDADVQPDATSSIDDEGSLTLEGADIEPFSFADLGLSDDEIASLNDLGAIETEDAAPALDAAPTELPAPEPERSTSAAQDEVEDLSEGLASGSIQPFSFADLGLSAEELALLDVDEPPTDQRAAADADSISDDLLRGEAGPDHVQTNTREDTSQSEAVDLDEGLLSGTIEPFSFADLGLSEEEIAAIDLGEAASNTSEERDDQLEQRTAAAAEAEDLSDGLASGSIQPFSFADLGLSEEEIASLNDLGDVPVANTQATNVDDQIEDDVQPFSLSDLGLSDEELDTFDAFGASPTGGTAQASSDSTEGEYELPSDLQPFSLDELDISGSEPDDFDSTSSLPSSLRPFSLDESLQSQADLPAPPAQENDFSRFSDASEDEPSQQTGGYSWQEPLQRPQPGFLSSMNKEDQGEGASIFTKLKQRKQEEPAAPEEEPAPATDVEANDRLLFSMDDVSLRVEETSDAGATAEDTAADRPAIDIPSSSATQMSQDAASEDLGDAVAAGEIQPFSLSELGLSEEEIAALGLGDAAESTEAPAQHTSTDADTTIEPSAATPATGADDVSAALASGEVQPFSFADLGLSEDEIASLDLGEAAAPSSEQPQAADDVSAALASGEVQPFSFADLGLSEDEIASLDLGGDAAPSSEQPQAADDVSAALASGEVQPFSFADLGLSEDEIASLDLGGDAAPSSEQPQAADDVSAALASGEVQPFSFADLGLSEDEIASLDLGGDAAPSSEQPQAASGLPADAEASDFLADFGLDAAASAAPEAADQVAQGQEYDALLDEDLQPFSFADLGLSDEESDVFGANAESADKQQTGLDITEDDLAGLDFGTPEWMRSSPSEQPQPSSTNITPADAASSDAVVAQLVALGQQQGYIDVADIIAAIGDTEADEAQVEAVVQELQDASIQIRDGDEIIDLSADEDADGADELDLAPSSPASPAEEPDLTPFSLAELGLSDEEIALLGLADTVETPAFTTDVDATEGAAPIAEQTAPPSTTPEATAPTEQAEPALPPALAGYVQQLENDPQNHILRLSIARAVGQAGLSDMSVQQYRHLIKQNALLDVIVDDIRDLIDEVDDSSFLQRLHRLLGDAYSRQGRLGDAMAEYSWVAQ